MDPVSAVGLTASLIAISELGTKLLKRVKEYSTWSGEFPKDVEVITNRLPILLLKVDEIKKNCDDGSLPDANREALRRAVDGCARQVELLDAYVVKITPAPNKSSWDRAKQAFRSIRSDREFQAIQKRLNLYEGSLAFALSDTKTLPIRDASNRSKQRIFDVPSILVRNFVGRRAILDDIKATFQQNHSGSGKAAVAVLTGMGGAGKTQIALEVCRSMRTTHSVFWIHALSPVTAIRSFSRVMSLISGSATTLTTIGDAVNSVIGILEAMEKQFLVVFDNLDDPDNFKQISSLIPRNEKASVLITSRARSSQRLGIPIEATPMESSEAVDLLLQQSGTAETSESRAIGSLIVNELGGLPLAIDQAASYISSRNLPLIDFDEHYKARKKTILTHTPQIWSYHREPTVAEEDSALSVYTTWELSFNQLGTTPEEREAYDYFLTLVAFMGPSQVSSSLFSRYFEKTNLDPPKWMQSFLDNSCWSNFQYQDFVALLTSNSLTNSMDISGQDTKISLHPLVREWLRLRTPSKKQYLFIAEAIKIMNANIKYEVEDGEFIVMMTPDQEREVLSHLESICDLALASESEDEALRETLTSTGAYFCYLLQHWERYDITTSLIEFALPKTKDVKKNLDLRYYLAKCVFRKGDANKAKELLVAVLDERKVLYGQHHRATWGAASALSNVLSNLGELEDAHQLLIKTLEDAEGALGLNHKFTLGIAQNLGIVLKQLGEYEAALKLYTRVFEEFKAKRGGNDALTISITMNLANLRRSMDDLEGAKELYLWGLERAEVVLGSKRSLTLDILYNLSMVYREFGDYKAAKEMAEAAFQGRLKLFGPNNPQTLNAENNLGAVIRLKGD